MQTYIERHIENQIEKYFSIFPVVAILGPRQCGKTTLSKHIASRYSNFVYLDLEKPSDLKKLDDAEVFFNNNREKRVCIDEIQLRPDLFPVLRGIIDEDRRNGKILLLGSASRDLLNQSSETLAGRIGYIELSPFLLKELYLNSSFQLNNIWLRGGFPSSYNLQNDEDSHEWRENFIKSYIERDLPQLGLHTPALTLRRLLTMYSHNQGQLINYSKIGESLGLSHNTIRNYTDFIEQTYLIRTLPPYGNNTKKRLIKSPKVFIRDSGILHALLNIGNFNELLGHPVYGSSWEGFVIENIVSTFYKWDSFFYRTSSGNEIDLILQKGHKTVAIESKANTAPKLSKGFYYALDDVKADETWVISLIDDYYEIRNGIKICSLPYFIENFEK